MQGNQAETNILIKALRLTGIILTGLFGIMMLGGDKVTSGSILLLTMIAMLLPIRQHTLLRRIRVGFVCVVFCLVIWNISTTDLPSDNPFVAFPAVIPEEPIETYSTGVRFLDQIIHIIKGFLEGRIFQAH